MAQHTWEERADRIREEDKRLRDERLALECATCETPLQPLFQDVLKCPDCGKTFCRACYEAHR